MSITKTDVASREKSFALIEGYQIIFLSILAITIPFFLEGPQLLVGSVVNAILVAAFWQVKDVKKVVSLIFLPSIAAFSRNLVFGPLTFYLIYLLPFIWISNTLYVFSIRLLSPKIKYLPALVLASAVKAGFLFTVSSFMINYSLIPKVFKIGMGVIQLVTALLGGMMAYIIVKIYQKIL